MSDRLIDRGHGAPILLVPGLPGRHEWMEPVISVMARRFRVLSFSLTTIDTDRFFDRSVECIDALMAEAQVARATLVGVSFGGLVAARYAARRPEAVTHLVLASAPSPRWQLDARSAAYVRRPALSMPLFALRGAFRMGPEVFAAFPTWRSRIAFAARYGLVALRAPGSPRRMAAWVNAWMTSNLVDDCRAIAAPTLVVTGETSLDRVVPVSSSLDYLRLIPHSRHAVVARTGHLGALMHPDQFTALVDDFVTQWPHAAATSSRLTAHRIH